MHKLEERNAKTMCQIRNIADEILEMKENICYVPVSLNKVAV